MRRYPAIIAIFLFLLTVSPIAGAADFTWIPDFNIKAEGDPAGFKARLAARFNLDAVRIDAIVQAVEKPADAYMVLKLGEMSHRPPEYVLKQYQSQKYRGWGTLAKSLGIKPGSPEFHALKRGSDLYGDGPGRGKGKKGKKKD